MSWGWSDLMSQACMVWSAAKLSSKHSHWTQESICARLVFSPFRLTSLCIFAWRFYFLASVQLGCLRAHAWARVCGVRIVTPDHAQSQEYFALPHAALTFQCLSLVTSTLRLAAQPTCCWSEGRWNQPQWYVARERFVLVTPVVQILSWKTSVCFEENLSQSDKGHHRWLAAHV